MKNFQQLIKLYKKSKKILNALLVDILNGSKKHSMLLPIVTLLVLLTGVYLYKEVIVYDIDPPLKKLPIATIVQHPYPIFASVLGAVSNKTADPVVPVFPQLSAQAAVVMDDDSKVILSSKNPGLRFSMASTTKIMTAITALAHFNMDDSITVYDDIVEGAHVGFTKGEQVRFEDMLYGLLLPSGNDVARAIAQNYPGGEAAFVAKMNENAASYHLYNTHYSDPTGLEDEGNYTTVVDLAHLASIAMKNATFAKIVGTKTYTLTTLNTRKTYSLHNLNKLLGNDGVVGIKTGFTDQAGEVLVTSKNEQGHQLIIVVMKSKDRFGDTKKLLSFIEGNIRFIPLSAP